MPWERIWEYEELNVSTMNLDADKKIEWGEFETARRRTQ